VVDHLGQLAEEPVERGPVGGVERRGALRADVGRSRLEPLGITPGQDDVGAFEAGTASGFESDTGASTEEDDGLPGVGTNVLSTRLRDLEAEGIIERTRTPTPTPAVLYELTDDGMALWPALYALRSWWERHSGRQPRVFTHDACGTQLDVTARCETCGVLPVPDHVFVTPVGELTARTDPVALGLRRKHRLLDFLPRDGDAA